MPNAPLSALARIVLLSLDHLSAGDCGLLYNWC